MTGTRGRRPAAPASVEDLVPPLEVLPGEDGAFYAALRAALLADLTPATPYERVLAENLVTIEWEAHRHRGMRDDLVRSAYRSQAQSLLRESWYDVFSVPLGETPEDVEETARALVGTDLERRASAEEAVRQAGATPSELLAKAYWSVTHPAEIHERKLAETEVRRRRLREDFERLKAARARAVEDVEFVDADD